MEAVALLMKASQYRQKAEELLSNLGSDHGHREMAIREADVWARLAATPGRPPARPLTMPAAT